MRAFLNGAHGNLPVPAGSSLLGRGQDCGLRIDDPRLSRHHARLLHDGVTLIIEDLGSTNGVLVNGERIQGKKNLNSGDTVVCGPCVFTIAIDPTQRATPGELVPSSDRKPDPHRTETMDPLNLPGSDRTVSKGGRQINPLIAAALSGSGEFLSSDAGSDILKPNEEAKFKTSVLIHRSDTTPRGNAIPPPPRRAEDSFSSMEKSTGLIPADFSPQESVALQPDFVTALPSGPAPTWKRAFAAIADSATLLLVMALAGLPVVVVGYAWALTQAGAVIEQGLPQLTSTPGAGAGIKPLIASLLHTDGCERAFELAARLMRADDQQPFLTLFAATALGVLFTLVAAIVNLIGATVVRGAPYWHRKLAIEIVEAHTGYQLTWGRAVARWFFFLLLWPLAPLALSLDRRSLHDVLSGCAVRAKRR